MTRRGPGFAWTLSHEADGMFALKAQRRPRPLPTIATPITLNIATNISKR
jgi:hypothetical protein